MSHPVKPHIPDLFVEQYALGELPEGTRREEVEAAVKGGSDVIEDLERSNLELLAAHPSAAMAASIERRLRLAEEVPAPRRALWLQRGLAAGVACAAAAVALYVFWPSNTEAPQPEEQIAVVLPKDDPEITRDKGLSPQITVHRKTAQDSEKLANGQTAKEHDLLQLGYIAAGRPYGVLLSVDGAHVVTLHFPTTEQSSTLLERSGEVYLPTSYELDAAPRFEHFFFITSNSELDVSAIVEAAQRWADSGGPNTRLPLPDTLEQSTLRLLKEPR